MHYSIIKGNLQEATVFLKLRVNFFKSPIFPLYILVMLYQLLLNSCMSSRNSSTTTGSKISWGYVPPYKSTVVSFWNIQLSAWHKKNSGWDTLCHQKKVRCEEVEGFVLRSVGSFYTDEKAHSYNTHGPRIRCSTSVFVKLPVQHENGINPSSQKENYGK